MRSYYKGTEGILLFFSSSVMSNSLWAHELQHQHASLLGLSLSPGFVQIQFMSIKSKMPYNHLILHHPLLLLSIFLSFRVFSNESALWIRWPKYLSFNFSISLSINIQGLFPLGLTGLILLSTGLLRVFSSTIVGKHQFLGSQPSLCFNSHIHMWILENHSFD